MGLREARHRSPRPLGELTPRALEICERMLTRVWLHHGDDLQEVGLVTLLVNQDAGAVNVFSCLFTPLICSFMRLFN